jgi:hypothetical protein
MSAIPDELKATMQAIIGRSPSKPATPKLDYTSNERLLLSQAVYECGNQDWDGVHAMLRDHPLLRPRTSLDSANACQTAYIHLMSLLGHDACVSVSRLCCSSSVRQLKGFQSRHQAAR